MPMELKLPTPRSDRLMLAIVLLLVALHGVKTALFIGVGQPPLYMDPFHYWSGATRMIDGDWLMVRGAPEVIRTPGYPLFLALFQLAFGRYALVMVVVAQQTMVFLTALLAGWMCRRVTGSTLGLVLGLTFGLACVSQNAIAVQALSDTLFCLVLTTLVAVLFAWADHPTLLRAAAVGLLLAMATLIRPIAQLAWVPVLGVMAFRLYGSATIRHALGHVVCLMAAMLALLAPWYARSYYYCGRPFLAKCGGLTMWASCFKGNPDDPLDPPLPFADSPKTTALLARLDGVNLHGHWAVFRALQRQNLSHIEADDLMQAVCLEAIQARPWNYLVSRARRYAWFWITPNGNPRPNTSMFRLFSRLPPDEDQGERKALPGSYANQEFWCSDAYFHRGSLNWLWYPNPWSYSLVALLTLAGCAAMISIPGRRVYGLTLAMLLLYFSAVTVVGSPPEYRYRMVLEPLMLVSIVPIFTSIARTVGQALQRPPVARETQPVASVHKPLPDGLWVVIAAHNEQRRIGRVLDELLRTVRNIVVVDDGSEDETAAEVAKRPVWLVKHGMNLGQGASLQTGISFALSQRARTIVTFDADDQHTATDIPLLVDAMALHSADFALGSRFLGDAAGIPLGRKIVLRLAVLFTRILSGVALTDAHNGLRAMTRNGAERILITMNRMEHASEIIDQIARSGLKFVEVPVHIKYTEESLAKGQKSSAALGLAIKLLLEKVIR